MSRYHRILYALLLASALLAGCDVNSPAAATPAPSGTAQPGTPPATGAPADNPTSYPAPAAGPTAEPTAVPPGYVPPSPQP